MGTIVPGGIKMAEKGQILTFQILTFLKNNILEQLNQIHLVSFTLSGFFLVLTQFSPLHPTLGV